MDSDAALPVHRYMLAVLAIIAVFAGGAAGEAAGGGLRLYFLDVGKGSALYVRTPRGAGVLVDAGPSEIVLRRLSEVLPWRVRRIDLVIETQGDALHAGGLPIVLSRYETKLLARPRPGGPIDAEISKAADERGVRMLEAVRPRGIDTRDGVSIELYPAGKTVRGNIRFGSFSLPLLGDSGAELDSIRGKGAPRLRPEDLGTVGFETDGASLVRIK